MKDLRRNIAPGIIRAQGKARIGAWPLQGPPGQGKRVSWEEPIRRQRHGDDGNHQECTHVLAEVLIGAKRDAVGTGRLMPDGKIGRMAVLTEYRGKGIGGEILTALVEAAKSRGLHEVYLHAQSHAMAFYQRFDFVVEGDEFQEAGIPHLKMRQTINYGEQRTE